MRINTNTWNKIRYTIYAPFYDIIENVFSASRKKSIDLLKIQPNEKVLLIGAGTGLDLPYIPKNAHITATDITPSMIEKIKQRSKQLQLKTEALVMDGQKLNFPDKYFDKIILHLILAVIPDPVACIKEAERVLKAGGEIVVFDKFIPENAKVSAFRKMMNNLTTFFFSDITRNIEEILAHTSLIIIEDIKANFGGNFRIIKIKKDL